MFTVKVTSCCKLDLIDSQTSHVEGSYAVGLNHPAKELGATATIVSCQTAPSLAILLFPSIEQRPPTTSNTRTAGIVGVDRDHLRTVHPPRSPTSGIVLLKAPSSPRGRTSAHPRSSQPKTMRPEGTNVSTMLDYPRFNSLRSASSALAYTQPIDPVSVYPVSKPVLFAVPMSSHGPVDVSAV
ncbi:uncharacterized protein M421DRAFT_390902 [Didymella exigua CBS 183.55]|uniref:Uncharacterized protein n=1 Tax=Didymella exigua CBS 183.55 TaxID=1150837 RepID=A0A6A5RPN3_9PLEO|nr:uncharacterized protein M421DRAFT_390902 [Didymella exigua CBS 183.55]KAF1929004.1 hypothetical protein M421DRAFT_390902 [Didymella exigua CBS 183.55]